MGGAGQLFGKSQAFDRIFEVNTLRSPPLPFHAQGGLCSPEIAGEAAFNNLEMLYGSLKFSWLVAILAADAPLLHSAEYEVEGRLEGVRHLDGGQVYKIPPVSFQVTVQDCKWMIHAQNEGSPNAFEHVMSFDGQYMYKLGVRSNEWGGAVSREGVPFFGPFPTIPVIWLALASGCYLETHEKSIEPPYSTAVWRPAIPVSISLSKDPARLPQTVVFLDDGYDRSTGVAQKREAPYDRGFTNALYSVSKSTNVSGGVLPAEFELQVFRANPSNHAEGVELDYSYTGYITAVRGTCSTSNFVPTIPADIPGYISDKRFASMESLSAKPFEYQAQRWLSESEVERLPRYAAYAKSQQSKITQERIPILVEQPAQAPVFKRSLIRGMLLLSIVSPILLLTFVWIKKSRQNSRRLKPE